MKGRNEDSLMELYAMKFAKENDLSWAEKEIEDDLKKHSEENCEKKEPVRKGLLYDAFYGTIGSTVQEVPQIMDADGTQFREWDGEEMPQKEPAPDPRYVPVYSRDDIDKIVMMLTLWIPDIDIRNKLEEIYQCWKDTQKIP